MTTETFIALFPGQGSQKVGMGRALSESATDAKVLFEQADSALGFSLSKLCFEGPMEELTKTEVAQPAILTVSTICYRLARQACTRTPVAAAGHSLGEYSALVAAGAIEFADAVVLVNKRGQYMQEAVPVGVGGMCAVLGKTAEEIEAAIAHVQSGVVAIANVNAPGQIVVAGARVALEELKKVMAGSKIIDLTVSAPFHSPLMAPAARALQVDLANLAIKRAAFPIYANYSAAPVQEPEEIRQALELQVCGRVRWVESMERAIQDTSVTEAIEYGEGNVLTGLLKRINPAIKRSNIGTPADFNCETKKDVAA